MVLRGFRKFYGKTKIRNIRVDVMNYTERNSPLTEGQVLYNQELTDRGSGGTTLFKTDGYVVFVNDGKLGDKVNVRIERVLPTFAFAEIIE